VVLFLQTGYAGGVWETTKELMQDLAALNRVRGRLALTLGLHDLQEDTRPLERLRPEVTLKRVRMNPILRSEAVRMFCGTPPWLAARPEKEFCFLSGAALTALRADAWLALVDRFPLPLLPARPYGVVVYDMIQSYAPEGFPPTFFTDMAVGMTPSVRAADRVLVTSPQTREDAIRGYGLDPAKVSLVPLACNPAQRFGHLRPVRVPRVREPFIMNVAGRGRHKGAEVMLRGYARLKARLGKHTPRLVFCGFGTDEFAPRYKGPVRTLAHSRAMRRLVRDLGLVQGRDVTFLGFRTEAELLDLYQRCSVVVNAALYDNGTFTVLEGAYFGRPAVSSRYPAAEFISERFCVPTEFFPCGDPDGLADAVLAALRKGPDSPADVERTRARFTEPEYSSRRYAERVYDVLVSLAEQGRRTRHAETWLTYAAWPEADGQARAA
jgi:glycosyltransferase involved in cell wall biosynthesis